MKNIHISEWEIIVSKATLCIAIATVMNVLVAAYTGYITSEYTKITKQIYEASNRPYVGISSIKSTKDVGQRKIYIEIQSKNFGSIPASNVKIKIDTILGGYIMEDIQGKIYNMHFNLFPQNTHNYGQKISSNFTEITNGNLTLDLLITVSYSGINGKDYKDYERWRYDSGPNSFFPIEADTK